jgi:hypothetical protein
MTYFHIFFDASPTSFGLLYSNLPFKRVWIEFGVNDENTVDYIRGLEDIGGSLCHLNRENKVVEHFSFEEFPTKECFTCESLSSDEQMSHEEYFVRHLCQMDETKQNFVLSMVHVCKEYGSEACQCCADCCRFDKVCVEYGIYDSLQHTRKYNVEDGTKKLNA